MRSHYVLLIALLPILSNCQTTPGMTIREGTLLRLDDGWEIGLELIYTDQAHTLARLSVWDSQAPQATTLVVHEGAVFDAGRRYQVVKIRKAHWPAWFPGTAGGSITISPVE